MSTETRVRRHATKERISEHAATELLSRVRRAFQAKTFQPHLLFSGSHAQTLAAYAWPRRHRYQDIVDEERLFEIEANVRVLAHCRWQPKAVDHPTILIWHGIEGSTASVYMLSTAEKAFRAGFNVVRVNLRNCGGTEHLTPTLYHGGLSGDLRAVLNELIERDGLRRGLLVGYSLSGNLVFKPGSGNRDNLPPQVFRGCARSRS